MTENPMTETDRSGADVRGASEDVAAAERYLAARFAAGTKTAADVASVARPRRLWISLEWASNGRCLRGWMSALRSRSVPRPRTLSVVERLNLGPKKSLWIVACGVRRFLVADSAETIETMLELGPGDRIPVVTPERWMAERLRCTPV